MRGAVDAADAFARLYDQLVALSPAPTDIDAWLADKAADDRRALVEGSLRPDATVPEDTVDCPEPAEAFGALRALDNILRAAGGTVPLPKRAVATLALRRRYLSTGRLDVGGPGAVLPGRVSPGRPAAGAQRLSDAVHTVRVSKATWHHVALLRVPPGHDHPHRAGDNLRLSALPMLGEPADLVMAATETAGRAIYVATPAESVTARVPAAAGSLPDCDIALLPESTLTDDVADAWRRELTDLSPTWVLIGTGPVTVGDDRGGSARRTHSSTTREGEPLMPNRAVLVHGPSATIIAVQDKQRGFTLEPSMLADYGLAGAPAVDHDEGVLFGKSLTLVESRAGRFVILICEDLGRLAELAPAVLELGVSHAFTPILATPILAHRWQQTAGTHLTTHGGTTVLVANSVALGRFVPDGEGTDVPADTVMVIETNKKSYSPHVETDCNPASASMNAEQDALTPRLVTATAR